MKKKLILLAMLSVLIILSSCKQTEPEPEAEKWSLKYSYYYVPTTDTVYVDYEIINPDAYYAEHDSFLIYLEYASGWCSYSGAMKGTLTKKIGDNYHTGPSAFTYDFYLAIYETHGQWSYKSDVFRVTENTQPNTVGAIPKDYWGSWSRMDAREITYDGTIHYRDMYIDSYHVYEQDGTYYNPYKIIQNDVKGITTDGKYILIKNGVYYFRKGGAGRKFSATVSGFGETVDSYVRAIGSGKQKVTGRRKNKTNTADSEEVAIDDSGKLNFTDAIADDTQTVTVSSSDSGFVDTIIDIVPKFDGENIGSIPLVEKGKYGFKSTYTIDGDAQGYCYAGNTYTVKLTLTNIGDTKCQTSKVTITTPNNFFVAFNGSTGQLLSGNVQSLNPGQGVEFEFTIKYTMNIPGNFIDIPLNITIDDSATTDVWNDTVTVRFYRGRVRLDFNAITFGSDESKLNGFVIYPDGRSQRFSIKANTVEKDSYIYIPWSLSPYYIVFTGALDNYKEVGYSFTLNGAEKLADLTKTWETTEIRAYEPNNATTDAANVTSDVLAGAVKGYLTADDVDFYKFYNYECDIVAY